MMLFRESLVFVTHKCSIHPCCSAMFLLWPQTDLPQKQTLVLANVSTNPSFLEAHKLVGGGGGVVI